MTTLLYPEMALYLTENEVLHRMWTCSGSAVVLSRHEVAQMPKPRFCKVCQAEKWYRARDR